MLCIFNRRLPEGTKRIYKYHSYIKVFLFFKKKKRKKTQTGGLTSFVGFTFSTRGFAQPSLGEGLGKEASERRLVLEAA